MAAYGFYMYIQLSLKILMTFITFYNVLCLFSLSKKKSKGILSPHTKATHICRSIFGLNTFQTLSTYRCITNKSSTTFVQLHNFRSFGLSKINNFFIKSFKNRKLTIEPVRVGETAIEAAFADPFNGGAGFVDGD